MKSRSRSQKKGLDYRLLLIPALAAAGPMFGTPPMAYQIQLARCPTGTFLAGLSQIDSSRVNALFFFSGLAVMLVVWALLIQLFGKSGRTSARKQMDDFLEVVDVVSRRKKVAVAVVALALAVASIVVSLWAFSPKFCLTDAVIFIRAAPSREFHRYAWDRVSRIDTECHYEGRGAWHSSFVVTMQDGADFDLRTAGREILSVYPKIVRGLKSANYVFSYSGSESCGGPLGDILSHRP
jgi:hypothetical protein